MKLKKCVKNTITALACVATVVSAFSTTTLAAEDAPKSALDIKLTNVVETITVEENDMAVIANFIGADYISNSIDIINNESKVDVNKNNSLITETVNLNKWTGIGADSEISESVIGKVTGVHLYGFNLSRNTNDELDVELYVDLEESKNYIASIEVGYDEEFNDSVDYYYADAIDGLILKENFINNFFSFNTNIGEYTSEYDCDMFLIMYEYVGHDTVAGWTGKLFIKEGIETILKLVDDDTQVPPADDGTQVPPTDDGTQVPPTDDGTQVPPTDDDTQVPPTDDGTQVPPTDDDTQVPPTDDDTQVPPTDDKQEQPNMPNTKPSSPQTGDSTSVYTWLFAMFVCLSVIFLNSKKWNRA